MPTELSPEGPQPVEGDTALPGMPTVDEMAAQLANKVTLLRQLIADKVKLRKDLQKQINEHRVELIRAERLLRATKPRGVK